MAEREDFLHKLRAALDSVAMLDRHRHSVQVDWDGEAVTLSGEVPSVAAKKLALEAVAAVPGVGGIVDRLRVQPAQHQGDGEIWQALSHELLQEPAFGECRLRGRVGHRPEAVLRDPPDARGDIAFHVADGVVTLDGAVPGPAHKRLAGVLAWWVPGARDVVNGLAVEPAEDDSDDELADAVRLVLEKDPYVNASQIKATARDYVVTLTGVVPSESERDMAEKDAWYVFGVDRVVNEIEVRP